jgi:phosphohistidine phosphatase
MRHAKSSWDSPNMADFDRALNNRGLKNAPEMGRRLKERGLIPDTVISSPAVRAYETCRIICSEIGYDINAIKLERSIYDGDEDEILDVIRNLPDKYDSVMIFAHNPGITFFVNDMADENIHNIPTCGYAELRLEIEEWKDAAYGEAELVYYDYPKKQS